MTTADKMVAALAPGQSIRLTGDAKTFVTAERSGDGKTLRYVRNTSAGFVVFRTMAF